MKRKFAIPRCPHSCEVLPIGPDLPWLAPLAGYSDLPFRLLCREYGASVCVTEMVSAKGLIYESSGTLPLLESTTKDCPLVVQLFGNEAPILGKAVEMLCQAGFGWFDLNIGCSVRKVLRQGAGAGMLEDIDNLLAVAKAMIKVAGPGHVGFKLRLGMDADTPLACGFEELCLRLQDLGAGWLTLHPRYARQGFGGAAHWQVLADLKQKISLPLLASGDLFTAADGIRCLAQTSVDGLMYARGALQDPAIFDSHHMLLNDGVPPSPSARELLRLIRRHVELVREFCPEVSALRRMRSIVPRYVKNLPGVKNLRLALCRCDNWQTLDRLLDDFVLASPTTG